MISGSQDQLLSEHIAHLLGYVEAKQVFKLREVAQSWEQGAALAIDQVTCELNGNSNVLESLLKCAKRLPALRRLNFRRSRDLKARDLCRFLEAAAAVQEVDVTLARPLEWQAYKELCDRFSSVRFIDSLTQSPNPDLQAEDVLFTQCYGLHAGRVDVCFAHASPANRAQTGPLSRFTSLFEPPSPYAIMVHSDWFQLGEIECRTEWNRGRADCIVEFEKQGRRRLFQWTLSIGQDSCWGTDGVVEASWHDMMMAQLDE